VDQELTEHTAAVPAILQVVSGGFRVSLGDTLEDLAPGSWVHMAANLPHSVLALDRGTLLLTLMRDPSE
jgi:quercetin dioxygenase-like cupin family protein